MSGVQDSDQRRKRYVYISLINRKSPRRGRNDDKKQSDNGMTQKI